MSGLKAGSEPESDARVLDRLAEGAADDIEHFLDVALWIALLRSRPNAALDVVFENQQGHRVDGGPKRGGLLKDVDAVLAALDHPLDAAHLALDTPESAHQNPGPGAGARTGEDTSELPSP